MNAREARKLERKIDASGTCEVAGQRVWDNGDVEITVHDRIEGGTFVVRSEQDWEDRVRAANLYK